MENVFPKNFYKKIPAVRGVFKERKNIQKIFKELQAKNFSEDEISIHKAKSHDLCDTSMDKEVLVGAHTGALFGIVIGALLLVLASFNFVTLPGQPTWIQAGAFLSAVAGACLGANAGAFAGLIVGFIITKSERRRFEHYIENRGVVISVQAKDVKSQLIAKSVLVTNGAVKVMNTVLQNYDGAHVYNKGKVASPLQM